VLVEQRAGTAIETIPSSPRPSLAPTSRTRILVVDDEPALGRGLQRMLREYEVVVATGGAEALELIARGERFDVVLCDLMMPDMPGFDLHAQLRVVALDQAERMIFMTGGATTTRAREFVACTSRVVLQKPLDAQHLREVIRANAPIKGAPAAKNAK
jgi:two-component system cell cycle sensor histidine kinase/response regulator CckA